MSTKNKKNLSNLKEPENKGMNEAKVEDNNNQLHAKIKETLTTTSTAYTKVYYFVNLLFLLLICYLTTYIKPIREIFTHKNNIQSNNVLNNTENSRYHKILEHSDINELNKKILTHHPKEARCYLIPSLGSLGDGHVKFYQHPEIDNEVNFEIEIYSSKIDEIVIYSQQNRRYNSNYCNNLGEVLLKLPINQKELLSENNIIKAIGSIKNFSLFDDLTYSYTCAARVETELKEMKNVSCGRLQRYDLIFSLYFGLSVVLFNLIFIICYLYKYGI